MKRKIGKQSRLFLTYSIYDFKGDPNAITKILKQSPTEIQRRGEPNLNGRGNAMSSSWSYTTTPDSYRLEEHLLVLLKKIRNVPKLNESIGKYKSHINIVLEIIGDDTQPILVVAPKVVAKMAEFKIGFSVDYYFFPK